MAIVKALMELWVGRVFAFAENRARIVRERESRERLKSVGSHVVMSGVHFSGCDKICLGDYVYIGPGTEFVGRGGIRVGGHTIIGPGVLIMSSLHNWDKAEWLPYDNVEWLKPVSIGEACWIGARAIVLPGVKLGPGSVVGAGAVVTKACDPGSVLAGNPARVIKRRDPAQLERCLREGLFYLKKKEELGMALNDKQEVRAGQTQASSISPPPGHT